VAAVVVVVAVVDVIIILGGGVLPGLLGHDPMKEGTNGFLSHGQK